MKFNSFLKLVEIQTKVASIIPFLLGTVYTLYYFDSFNWPGFILLFISLLTFDMATTATNNYLDYKTARKTFGYNYESHNVIVRDNLKEAAVRTTIILLLVIAMVAGFFLFINTSVVILVIGIFSFAVGVAYSAGPIPISRTPFGEIFSGLFMGYIITLISIYIHVYDQGMITLGYQTGILKISLDISQVLSILLVSVPAVIGIANIMLANNICDIEDDIENKRYTLPIYIGRENALTVFKFLYYLIYLDLALLVIFRIIPLVSLLTMLTLIPVSRNIQLFMEKQSKRKTFVLAVKNFILINMVYILTIGVAVVLKR